MQRQRVRLLCVSDRLQEVVPMITLSQAQGMADLLVRCLVIDFHPLVVTVVIEPSKKLCPGALELLDYAPSDRSLFFASRCQVDFTIPVNNEVKIVVSVVIHDVQAASTDDIPRTT